MSEEAPELTYSKDMWDGFFDITSLYSRHKDWMKANYHSWKNEAEYIQKTGKYYEKMERKGFSSNDCGVFPIAVEKEMKDYYAAVGEKMVEMANLYEKELFNELRNIKHEVADLIKEHTSTEKKLEKQLRVARAQAESARKADASQSLNLIKLAEARRATDELSVPPKKIEKMNKHLTSAKESASKAREHYESQVNNLHEVDAKYKEEMKNLLDQMQKYDEERLEKTKEIFIRYTDKQIELGKEMVSRGEKMKASLENADTKQSIQLFIEDHKSNGVPPEPDTFKPNFSEAYQMDEVVEKAINTSSRASSLNGPPKASKRQSSILNVSSNEPSIEPNVEKKAKALYDYEPERDDEMEIKEGDKIDVYSMADDGWWRGKNHRTEAVGEFPSNFVVEIGENSNEDADDNQQADAANAIYEYTAQDSTELSFDEGDALQILESFDDGWAYAENTKSNEKGLIPLNYTDRS